MKYIVEDTRLIAIADAIRGKTGKTEAITLEQMPLEIASIVGGDAGGDAGGYTHALYNGVRLPILPEEAALNYPRALIRKNNDDQRYDLYFSTSAWYYTNTLTRVKTDAAPHYIVNFADMESATEWVYEKDTSANVNLSDTKTLTWSNRDIDSGSVGSGYTYFRGSDPVPTN